jgi:ABC-type glycerol-3-phosphate transport system substrate-binding protein
VGTLNNPATIEVMRAVADYRLKERIAPSAADLRGSTFRGSAYELLLRGHYAMLLDIGYRSRIRDAFESDPDVWDVAPMPRGTKGAAVRGAWSPFGMGAQTKQPAAAWELMKFATGPEGQTILTELGYLYSVRRSVAEKVFIDPRSPQHEERWLEAVKYQHFEPLNEVYEKVRQVHNFYWSQITDESVRRPVAETVRLADEVVNAVYQGGDIPPDWEGLPKQ